jgi:hypothetical protein
MEGMFESISFMIKKNFINSRTKKVSIKKLMTNINDHFQQIESILISLSRKANIKS